MESLLALVMCLKWSYRLEVKKDLDEMRPNRTQQSILLMLY
jgi:hypothetical protein